MIAIVLKTLDEALDELYASGPMLTHQGIPLMAGGDVDRVCARLLADYAGVHRRMGAGDVLWWDGKELRHTSSAELYGYLYRQMLAVVTRRPHLLVELLSFGEEMPYGASERSE